MRNRLRATDWERLFVFPGKQCRTILADNWILSFRDGPGLVDFAGRSWKIDPATGGVGTLAWVVRRPDSSSSVPSPCLHKCLQVPDARHHPDHRHAHRAGDPPPDTNSAKTWIVTDDPVECSFGRLRRRSNRRCFVSIFLFAGSRSVSYIIGRRRPQRSFRFGNSYGRMGSTVGQGPGTTRSSGRPHFHGIGWVLN